MNHKAQVGVVIGIIFIIILIIVAIVSLIIVLQKSDTIEKKEGFITLYIDTIDAKSEEKISSNFMLTYLENDKENYFLSDSTSNSILELERKADKNYNIYCWNNDYYYNTFKKSSQGLIVNATKFTCSMDKIGNLEINLKGDLSETLNYITINLSSDNYFKNIGICFAWTTGIIDVLYDENPLTCNTNWINYTNFTSDLYKCNNKIQSCLSINKTQCYLNTEQIPYRFLGQVDKCFYLGKSLNSSSLVVPIRVKTLENKNSLDYLEIIVYDKDLRWNDETGYLEMLSELKGENIASDDFSYKLYFQS